MPLLAFWGRKMNEKYFIIANLINAIAAAIGFDMTNHRFNGTSTLPPFAQGPGQAFSEPIDDLDVAGSFVSRFPIAQVAAGHFRYGAHEALGLLQRSLQGVSIVGISRKRLRSHDPVALRCADQANLHAKLVGFVDFPFGNALHLRRMNGIDLALVGKGSVL